MCIKSFTYVTYLIFCAALYYWVYYPYFTIRGTQVQRGTYCKTHIQLINGRSKAQNRTFLQCILNAFQQPILYCSVILIFVMRMVSYLLPLKILAKQVASYFCDPVVTKFFSVILFWLHHLWFSPPVLVTHIP